MRPLMEWYRRSSFAKVLAVPFSIVVLAVIFLPFFFFFRKPTSSISGKHALYAEAGILVASDLIAIMGIALCEWGF